MLQKINSLESRLTHKINLHDKDFSLKLESLSEKILPISTDLSNLIQSSSENDKKLEKLDTFEKFKNKAESALLSQNIRLNKSFETISEMKAKYDKIFIDTEMDMCSYNKIAFLVAEHELDHLFGIDIY